MTKLFIKEIFRLGKSIVEGKHSSSGFLSMVVREVQKHPRASEIGRCFYDLGGKAMMLRSHKEMRDRLGKIPVRELEMRWNDIGDWLG